MKLTAIMAAANRSVIGRDGTIPWRLPPDLKRFKALTTGHAVIMGRKTFDSIGRPLPNRRNIVVSRLGLCAPGVEVFSDPDDALLAARQTDKEPFVIGGAKLWSALWKHVTDVEYTRVHLEVEPVGSLVFAFHAPLWELEWIGPYETHEGIDYQFMRYRRIASDESLRLTPATSGDSATTEPRSEKGE